MDYGEDSRAGDEGGEGVKTLMAHACNPILQKTTKAGEPHMQGLLGLHREFKSS